MDALSQRIGPYHYDQGFLRKKTFPTDGAAREFTVLVSSAYNAGIIGPENNGIVVLDDDNRCVVLDRHCEASTGYFGPTDRQKAEFERVMAMDWKQFAVFCKNSHRYRKGSVPDIDRDHPDPGRASVSEVVIFPDDKKPGEDCPYRFPLSTKREIVEFLSNHSGHDSDGRGYDFALSWSVKVGHADFSGDKHRQEMGLDPVFDRRWKEKLETDDRLFWEACEDGLRQWTEGDYTIWPGEGGVKYEFGTAGRSGGHLVLLSMDGHKMTTRNRHEFVEWLENDASDEELVELYKVVVSCDNDLANPAREVEYQMASIRQGFEEAWREERASLSQDARDAIVAAEADGGRLYQSKNGDWYAVDDAREEIGPFDDEEEAARGWLARHEPRAALGR